MWTVPRVSIPSISGTVTTHSYVPAVSNVASFTIKVFPFEISFPSYTHTHTRRETKSTFIIQMNEKQITKVLVFSRATFKKYNPSKILIPICGANRIKYFYSDHYLWHFPPLSETVSGRSVSEREREGYVMPHSLNWTACTGTTQLQQKQILSIKQQLCGLPDSLAFTPASDSLMSI